VNRACSFPSSAHIAIDVVLEEIHEILADEADVFGPLRDTIPPPAWPSLHPLPKPRGTTEKTVIIRPQRKVARWPVVLCATIAAAATVAAIVTSPFVGQDAVRRAAIAIHDSVFKS
jgi:hypothetical protein